MVCASASANHQAEHSMTAANNKKTATVALGSATTPEATAPMLAPRQGSLGE